MDTYALCQALMTAEKLPEPLWELGHRVREGQPPPALHHHPFSFLHPQLLHQSSWTFHLTSDPVINSDGKYDSFLNRGIAR